MLIKYVSRLATLIDIDDYNLEHAKLKIWLYEANIEIASIIIIKYAT